MLKSVKYYSLSRVQLLATAWTIACQLLCPWDSPGKKTRVGCHSFLRGDLLDPGIELRSPALLADSLTIRVTRESPAKGSVLATFASRVQQWKFTSERGILRTVFSPRMGMLGGSLGGGETQGPWHRGPGHQRASRLMMPHLPSAIFLLAELVSTSGKEAGGGRAKSCLSQCFLAERES